MTHVPDPDRSRAVLIGVADYAGGDGAWPSLPSVRQNLVDLRRVLCDPRHWGLPAEHCTVLRDPTDAGATLEAVTDAAEQASDLLLVYYAGHGAGTESDLLLTMSTVTTRRLGTRSIRYSALSEEIRQRTAAYAVVLLDCCFSGQATAMAVEETFIDAQISPTAGYVLASSARNQISLAPEGDRHTAFTGALIEVADGGIAAGPERLTFAALEREMRRRLAERGMPTPRFKQSERGDRLAVLSNRQWHPAPPSVRPAPAPTPRLDDSVEHGVALVAWTIRQLYGPAGSPVRAVDRTGAEVLCADAFAAAEAAGSSLPGADRGIRLVRELITEVRTEVADGAAAAVLIAYELTAGLWRHAGDKERRRAIAAEYARLADSLASALAEASVSVESPGRLAAVAATAACQDDLRAVLAALPLAIGGDLRVTEAPAGGPAFALDWEAHVDLPVRVVWPDLGGQARSLAWDGAAVLVVSGELHDASALVRLPADRPWVVIAERLGLPVRKMMQVNGRHDGLVVVEAQDARGGRIGGPALAAVAEALGTRTWPASGSVVNPGLARRVVLSRDGKRMTFATPADGEHGRAPTLRVARRDEEHEPSYAARLGRIRRMPKVLDAALIGGVVAGGGAALRAAGAAVSSTSRDTEAAEAFARATAAPAACLGGEDKPVTAGLLDPVPVVVAGVRAAIRLAIRATGT